MPRTKESKAFRVHEPFVVFHDGIPELFAEGRLVDSRNPIVNTHPQYLEPIDDVVERTTSAPGEKRHVPIPTKEDNDG